jgi:hypothetical protein
MQLELRREIKYLNLAIINDAMVTMDAKLKEIRQLIKDNKTNAFSEDSQGTLWLGKRICVPNLKHLKELIL